MDSEASKFNNANCPEIMKFNIKCQLRPCKENINPYNRLNEIMKHNNSIIIGLKSEKENIVSMIKNQVIKRLDLKNLKEDDISGAELFVSANDAGVNVDFTNVLNLYLNDKNSFAWGYYFFKGLVADFSPNVSIDIEKVNNIVSNWEIFDSEDTRDVTIEKTESGYLLNDELSNVPVKEEIITVVANRMLSLESDANLSNFESCYTDIEYTEKQKKTVELFEKINELQSCGIVYMINGESIPIGKEIASRFIISADDLEYAKNQKISKKEPWMGHFIVGGQETKFPDDEGIFNIDGFLMDNNGNLILSESRMHDFLYELAENHGTSWALDKYRNGDNDTKIYINNNKKGDGSIYDIESEFEYLRDAYLSGTNENEECRELKLSDNAISYDAKEKLGETYIEVNMGKQELTYYVDGKLNMNMPIVTGNVNRGRGTPTGIFSVYNKRYHTNLVGVNYVSYVNYWLGVNKGVGIHDATWRSNFGEEIYKRDGSHGCINCPLDSVSALWEVVEVGTPVILYY